ncbi:hypothetical protein HD554DRAFT_2167350 [Boletus coccyginus]|nr:hypothetical protein HD554DRAFT_2167350 [Boletus coccyginus]
MSQPGSCVFDDGNWRFGASEIPNEQASEERAHPSPPPPKPGPWLLPPESPKWAASASEILEEQTAEDEA